MKSTSFYDSCGFINQDQEGIDYFNKPSKTYANPADFIKKIMVPFLENDIDIEIVDDDSTDTTDDYLKTCFKSSSYLDTTLMALLLGLAILIAY